MKDKIIFSIKEFEDGYCVDLHFSNDDVETIVRGENMMDCLEEAIKLLKETEETAKIIDKETIH